MAVRLFIGNLPYGASEADLRAHFAAVAEPSHVVMPVDRETGRPRGFAFVEFVDRAAAEEVVKRFDAQPFQGRNLAVSEARAREDRPPRPPGSFSPRPPGGGFGGRWRPRRWRIRWSVAVGSAAVEVRRPTARRRRLRRPASRRVRPSSRSRRPRPQRQLRTARAAQAAARRQEGQRAAGEQTARADQGKERRPHLRRGRSGRRRAHRPRRRRDERARRRRRRGRRVDCRRRRGNRRVVLARPGPASLHRSVRRPHDAARGAHRLVGRGADRRRPLRGHAAEARPPRNPGARPTTGIGVARAAPAQCGVAPAAYVGMGDLVPRAARCQSCPARHSQLLAALSRPAGRRRDQLLHRPRSHRRAAEGPAALRPRAARHFRRVDRGRTTGLRGGVGGGGRRRSRSWRCRGCR